MHRSKVDLIQYLDAIVQVLSLPRAGYLNVNVHGMKKGKDNFSPSTERQRQPTEKFTSNDIAGKFCCPRHTSFPPCLSRMSIFYVVWSVFIFHFSPKIYSTLASLRLSNERVWVSQKFRTENFHLTKLQTFFYTIVIRSRLSLSPRLALDRSKLRNFSQRGKYFLRNFPNFDLMNINVVDSSPVQSFS